MQFRGFHVILRRFGGLRKFIFLLITCFVVAYCVQILFSFPRKTFQDRVDSSLNDIVVPGISGAGQSAGAKGEAVQPTIERPQLSTEGRAQMKNKQLENKAEIPPPAAAAVGAKVCGVSLACTAQQLTFNLSSSLDAFKPSACINNLMIFDNDKLVRGLNIIVLDEKKKAVQDIKYFDFGMSDREFVGFMVHIPDNRIILVASYGDIANRFSSDSREILAKFGCKQVQGLKPGETFVLLGQKGLRTGIAVEKIGHMTEQDEIGFASISGCMDSPMGPLEKVTFLNQRAELPVIKMGQVIRDVVYGDVLHRCGMREGCKPAETPVAVYSGRNKDDEPKICVNDRFVVSRNLNKAGRGLNIVVMNATSKEVLRVGHFDTYEQDSSTLEIFLEDTIDGEVVLVVSFDEASTRLSNMAKQMFYELGSGLVQNLKFRASWYFIGQKGIKGFTPFEELNYATNAEWAPPIDRKLCIPPKLDGLKVRPDPTVKPQNVAKRHFCRRFDGYEEFCDDAFIDDALTPAPLHNKSMEGNAIFAIPVLIIAGLSHNSLRLCLETVLRQPGIKPANVLVAYDENYPEVEALAHLFTVQAAALSVSSKHQAHVEKSFEKLWEVFPAAAHAIVIEEELLLTADFLFYMAQLLPVLVGDETLLAVSAWNDNGFQQTSSLPGEMYRVEGFPGLGFMLSRRVYDKFMKNQMEQCCKTRAWEGWVLSGIPVASQQMLVPDISRVYRRHAEGLGMVPPHIEHLFSRPRSYNTNPNAWIENPDALRAANYEPILRHTISEKAQLIDHSGLTACLSWDGASRPPPSITLAGASGVVGATFVTYVHQSSPADEAVLSRLADCFGLYYSPGKHLRGMFKDSIRFSYNGQRVLLIGSLSPLFSLKPPDYEVVKLSDQILRSISRLNPPANPPGLLSHGDVQKSLNNNYEMNHKNGIDGNNSNLGDAIPKRDNLNPNNFEPPRPRRLDQKR